jgi:hypothetical protein
MDKRLWLTVLALVFIFIMLTGLTVLSGCLSPKATISEDKITVEMLVTLPLVATTQATLTPEATLNLPTPTPPSTQPLEHTPTATREPSPTPTTTPEPFPTFDIAKSTLSQEAATQNLIELLETNMECELPCWWGIVPGETKVNSIESTFVPLGFDWYRDYEDLRDNTNYKASVSIKSTENIVQTIEVRGGAGEETYDRNQAWRPYALPRILEQLGAPVQAYVFYPFRFDRGGMQAYRLFLYYPELGVEVDYLGKAQPLDESPRWARACPSILETDEINLFLFQPGSVPDYLEQTLSESSLGFIPHDEGETPYDRVQWEQATGLSLDEFARLFAENPEGSVCFDFKTYWTGN